jgi:urease accessory protein
MNKIIAVPATLLALVLPGVATAHPGHDAGTSFAAGVWHPIAGLDHLAALIAVGLLAGRMGGRAGLTIAVTFLALLGAGIVAGFAGLELPRAETAIGASIFCIALLTLRPPRRLPVATAALAGLFAVFHGQAHGAEAADGTARLSYAAGLLLASAGVIVAGMWLAHAPAWNRLRLRRREA